MWYHDMFGEINMTLTKRPKSISKLARYNNMQAWQMWFRILVNKALNRYEFQNLPDTINERVLKLSLLWHASVCVFEKDGHLMALPGAAGTNGVTVYGDYTYSSVYGRNGFNEEIPLWLKGQKELPFLAQAYLPVDKFKKPRGVWFRENPLKFPFVDICISYADQIADTWRKMENMRSLLTKPLVISGVKEDVPTARALYEELSSNSPLIFLTRKLESGQFDFERLQMPPDTLKAYTDHIEWLLNQFEAECGRKTNANPDKKERLLTDEIQAGDEAARSNVDAVCDYMQKYGFDVVNEHYGTDIRVVPYGRRDGDDLSGMDSYAGSEPVE